MTVAKDPGPVVGQKSSESRRLVRTAVAHLTCALLHLSHPEQDSYKAQRILDELDAASRDIHDAWAWVTDNELWMGGTFYG